MAGKKKEPEGGTRKKPKKNKGGGKMKVGKVAVTAVKHVAAAGGVVALSVAASTAIEGKTGKPLHPAAKAGVSLVTAIIAAVVAVKLKAKGLAASIVTVGTAKAAIDAAPAFEDAGVKLANKMLPAGNGGQATAPKGIGNFSPRGENRVRDMVN